MYLFVWKVTKENLTSYPKYIDKSKNVDDKKDWYIDIPAHGFLKKRVDNVTQRRPNRSLACFKTTTRITKLKVFNVNTIDGDLSSVCLNDGRLYECELLDSPPPRPPPLHVTQKEQVAQIVKKKENFLSTVSSGAVCVAP